MEMCRKKSGDGDEEITGFIVVDHMPTSPKLKLN